MFDHLLSEKAEAFREEVRDFVGWVPREMILKMDRDQIRFPKEFLSEAGRRNLLGCRYPARWGGRDMDWAATCMAMEEIGTLGYVFACVFGVGAELVCDAIIRHGTVLWPGRPYVNGFDRISRWSIPSASPAERLTHAYQTQVRCGSAMARSNTSCANNASST